MSDDTEQSVVEAAKAFVNKYGSGTSEESKRLYNAVRALDRPTPTPVLRCTCFGGGRNALCAMHGVW